MEAVGEKKGEDLKEAEVVVLPRGGERMGRSQEESIRR